MHGEGWWSRGGVSGRGLEWAGVAGPASQGPAGNGQRTGSLHRPHPPDASRGLTHRARRLVCTSSNSTDHILARIFASTRRRDVGLQFLTKSLGHGSWSVSREGLRPALFPRRGHHTGCYLFHKSLVASTSETIQT